MSVNGFAPGRREIRLAVAKRMQCWPPARTTSRINPNTASVGPVFTLHFAKVLLAGTHPLPRQRVVLRPFDASDAPSLFICTSTQTTALFPVAKHRRAPWMSFAVEQNKYHKRWKWIRADLHLLQYFLCHYHWYFLSLSSFLFFIYYL